MRGDQTRRPPTTIGALTRRDRYREAALNKRIDDAYRSMSTTFSSRGRRRHRRTARRHERALVAQQRRPQSVLSALAVVLAAVLAVCLATRVSLTLAIVAATLLFVDLRVLRRRRRTLRRA